MTNPSHTSRETARRVAEYIARHNLLPSSHSQGRPCLVALSGGADSVALLRLLRSLGYEVEAAHCHFGLRPGEADRDEAFVRRLCTDLGVALHVEHFRTAEVARERHISVEMAARDLRYHYFEELRTSRQLQAICVAHHQDDSAETLLLNLIRGTGIDGLRGIQPRRGHIIRPLLCLTRQDILSYLDALGQNYVTDSTNLHDDYIRNRIRHHIIPALQAINPSVVQTLIRTAEHLEQAARVYHQALEEGAGRVCHSSLSPIKDDRNTAAMGDAGTAATDSRPQNSLTAGQTGPLTISIPGLLREPSPQALLHHLLAPRGFNSAQTIDIERSLQGQAGRQFISTTGWTAVKDRDLLYVNSPLSIDPSPLHIEIKTVDPGYTPPRDPHLAYLDADTLPLPLTLRTWRQGDSLVPLGMKGRKLVSNLLTDCHLPLHLRARQQVVCTARGDIAWVVGLRIAHPYRITPHTRHVLIISTTAP